MHKKAQGLSLNTIIVAIIVLIVLVVLIMIFTGYFGTRFAPEVTSCANAGGACQSLADGCGVDAFGNDVPEVRASCLGSDGKPDSTQVCCAKGLGQGAETVCQSVGGSCVATANCAAASQVTGTECEAEAKVCCVA